MDRFIGLTLILASMNLFRNPTVANHFKPSFSLFKVLSLVTILALSITQSFGQAKAQNTNCSLAADPGYPFTWTGGCYNGYCDGFGTLQLYDQNGNSSLKFVGYYKQGKANGYCTVYMNDGTILYQCNFVNDDIQDAAKLKLFGNVLGGWIMENVFDGGDDLRSSIVKLIDAKDGYKEIRYKISFNKSGIYCTTTIVIKNQGQLLDAVDTNDAALIYMTLKGLDKIKEYLDEHSNQQDGN